MPVPGSGLTVLQVGRELATMAASLALKAVVVLAFVMVGQASPNLHMCLVSGSPLQRLLRPSRRRDVAYEVKIFVSAGRSGRAGRHIVRSHPRVRISSRRLQLSNGQTYNTHIHLGDAPMCAAEVGWLAVVLTRVCVQRGRSTGSMLP